MRIDKNNPGQKYTDFFHWLRTDGHFIWVLFLVFAYLVYLLTTEEI